MARGPALARPRSAPRPPACSGIRDVRRRQRTICDLEPIVAIGGSSKIRAGAATQDVRAFPGGGRRPTGAVGAAEACPLSRQQFFRRSRTAGGRRRWPVLRMRSIPRIQPGRPPATPGARRRWSRVAGSGRGQAAAVAVCVAGVHVRQLRWPTRHSCNPRDGVSSCGGGRQDHAAARRAAQAAVAGRCSRVCPRAEALVGVGPGPAVGGRRRSRGLAAERRRVSGPAPGRERSDRSRRERRPAPGNQARPQLLLQPKAN